MSLVEDKEENVIFSKEKKFAESKREWFAGFFDFGISASVVINNQRQVKGGREYFYTYAVPVLSCEEWIFPQRVYNLARYGGKVYTGVRENKFSEGQDSFWSWKAFRYDACRIIRLVEPYLLFRRMFTHYFFRWEENYDRDKRLEIAEEFYAFTKTYEHGKDYLPLPSEPSLPYLAGLFDSCGFMSIYGGSARVGLVLQNASFASYLKGKFGGCLFESRGRIREFVSGYKVKGEKKYFNVVMGGKTGINFVKTILPYIQAQKELAEALILEA